MTIVTGSLFKAFQLTFPRMRVLQMRIYYFLSVVFCASLLNSIFMQYFAPISSEHMHLVGFVVRAFSFSQFGMLNLSLICYLALLPSFP
jgi:hypothetical protein